ncbi:uncharacterized protein yc1106_06385 [Curvularia clavata]|uniref:Uncharacterized protein n=1 Tax=Curvularia clavata TaxID=95742 RepID=A0A9Q8ZBE0_CURCL|nr:uncharacterized protein yc1106_06385 [Curvularia clavata]
MPPKKEVPSIENRRFLADLTPERRARLVILMDATGIEDAHEALHEHMGKETIADIVKAREEARRQRASSPVAEPPSVEETEPPDESSSESESSSEPESSPIIRERASPDPPREFLRLTPSTDPNRTTPRAAVLQPFRTDYLPPTNPDAPLFLPADARRHWYLGCLFSWKYFNYKTIEFWKEPGCQAAFNEIESYQVDDPRPTELVETLEENQQGPAKLEDYFRREVLEVVERIYNTLLTTTIITEECGDIVPQGIWIEKAAENEQLAAKGVKPTFVVRAKSASGEDETRLIGHVEYMGGRRGKLTVQMLASHILTISLPNHLPGNIARWMLEYSTQYGFLITSDEIMFIHFTPKQMGGRSIVKHSETKRVEYFSSWVQPELFFTAPMGQSDTLQEQGISVTARLALLHLIHTTTINEFRMVEDKGRCPEYFPTTEAGQKFRV